MPESTNNEHNASSPFPRHNGSENFSCGYDPDWFHQLETRWVIASYCVIVWIHFVFGTPGHLVLLYTFYQEYKQAKAYMYQVLSTLSEFAELQSFVALILVIKFLSGAEGFPGFIWFQKSYTLMWYTAHIVHGCFSLFFTLSLLLSVCMTADRVFALWKPFVYKNINNKIHQTTAFCICFLISIFTCYVEELMFQVVPDPDGTRYKVIFNENEVKKPFPLFIGHLRNAVRLFAMFILIALNCVLVYLFKHQMKQVSQMTNRKLDAKEIAARKQEKMLLALTMCQSCFQFISVFTECAYYGAELFSPWFSMCARSVGAPVMDIIVDLCDLFELYISLLVNKKFRDIIRNVITCTKNKQANTVVQSVRSTAC